MGISETMTIETTAARLKAADRILILCHQKPDGDTLGSGFALLYALRELGKTVRVESSDGFPPRYCFLYPDFCAQEQPVFSPALIVAVDIADTQLLGEHSAHYGDKIDLCIDHHPSNSRYAKQLLLDAGAAATVEPIYAIIRELGVKLNYRMAVCIYTGLATDTGCFRYSNTTVQSHLLAAEMMELGVDSYRINKLMFETKSAGRMELEGIAMSSLEFHYNHRLAMINMTLEDIRKTGVLEEDMEGIAAIPRQIEGVDVAVTLQQKAPERWRVSMRSSQFVDSSAVCARLGGGGHSRAAGCTLWGSLSAAKEQLIHVLRAELA